MTITATANNGLNGLSTTQSMPAIARHAPKNILHSINNAAQKTGVDFAYLVEKAAAESSFNPTAQAKTSSAGGLFQFIDQTWLQMVKQHGHKHGLGRFADMIERQDNGRFTVKEPQQRQHILNLKNNPTHAANMAAEFAKSNEHYLRHHVRNIDVGATELYFAHFMGANGAARFFNAMEQNPDQSAAQIFRKEAAANKNVFYDPQTGQARTLKQVYAFFDKKFDGGSIPAPNLNPAPTAPKPQQSISVANKPVNPDLLAQAHIIAAQTNMISRAGNIGTINSKNTGLQKDIITRTPYNMPRALDPVSLLLMADMDRMFANAFKG